LLLSQKIVIAKIAIANNSPLMVWRSLKKLDILSQINKTLNEREGVRASYIAYSHGRRLRGAVLLPGFSYVILIK